MQGYESEKDEQGIPVMSMKRESWNADVCKDKVLHQEVQQLEELKEKKHRNWFTGTTRQWVTSLFDLAFRWAETSV